MAFNSLSLHRILKAAPEKVFRAFSDPNLPGEMTTTIWLNKVSCGTVLKMLQEGIPSVIPIEMCYLGWQDSLDKLSKLVEPEILDA